MNPLLVLASCGLAWYILHGLYKYERARREWREEHPDWKEWEEMTMMGLPEAPPPRPDKEADEGNRRERSAREDNRRRRQGKWAVFMMAAVFGAAIMAAGLVSGATSVAPASPAATPSTAPSATSDLVEEAADQFLQDVSRATGDSERYVQLIWCQGLQLGSTPREEWRQNGLAAGGSEEFVDAVGAELDSRCEA